jgi:hypothetical protein
MSYKENKHTMAEIYPRISENTWNMNRLNNHYCYQYKNNKIRHVYE